MSSDAGKHHPLADVERAVGTLDSQAMSRLWGAARNSIRRYHLDGRARGHEDLLSEAVTRLLAGTRKWRRGVGFEYQIARVMDSIASEWCRQDVEAPEIQTFDLTAPAEDDEDVPAPMHAPSPEGSIEQRMVAGSEVREIAKLFAKEPATLQVLGYLCLGHSREEMCERTGMSKKEIAATIRRVRRRAAKLR